MGVLGRSSKGGSQLLPNGQGAGNMSDIRIRKLMLKRVRVDAAFFV